MDWELLFFLIFAAITIAAAISIMFSRDVVKAVMYLALTFIGVAVMFFFLEAEYIGLIQILIYVGAVTVLILFGIMLTKKTLLGGERDE
jgi:NADH:ubiquinone oxidoreductase subunit 6 (subunit J)